MRIVFAGSIGRLPVGGHAWVDMQYLIGLRELGHEVCYLEECGLESWVYHWRDEAMTTDLDFPSEYVRNCLIPVGYDGAWIYRAGDQSRGMSADAFQTFCRKADLLLVRAVSIPLWREEYRTISRRAFIDMDPAFTQIQLHRGKADLAETVERCQHVFTIGQRIGESDCIVPSCGRDWQLTLPPIALSHWPYSAEGAGSDFTTVMQWKSYKEVEYKGVKYGNKNVEFPRFMDLPQRSNQPFTIALTGGPEDKFRSNGWKIMQGWEVSETIQSYQEFVQSSRAEFSVAKHGYVATRCGWISDRTLCYLASGRPALLQDTGLPAWLQTGEGVILFNDADGALEGVKRINEDYDRHRRAARELAERYFAVQHVLPPLLERAVV